MSHWPGSYQLKGAGPLKEEFTSLHEAHRIFVKIRHRHTHTHTFLFFVSYWVHNYKYPFPVVGNIWKKTPKKSYIHTYANTPSRRIIFGKQLFKNWLIRMSHIFSFLVHVDPMCRCAAKSVYVWWRVEGKKIHNNMGEIRERMKRKEAPRCAAVRSVGVRGSFLQRLVLRSVIFPPLPQ